MSQVIVLGWDALDVALIEEFGLTGRFGTHRRRIDTYVNPATGEPHTKELWPSLITGLHPDEHGIHAVTDSDGIEWDSDVLNVLSSLANGVVPDSVLTVAGQKLRAHGAALPMKRTEYYADLPTVFDGLDAKAISIPNYQTAPDRQLGLDANRDDVWATLVTDRTGEHFTPGLSRAETDDILGRELGKRLGQTITAIQAGHDLVWSWFGLLDTVGHIAPAFDGDIQRAWYSVAASVTETVQRVAGDNAVVLSLSDHGLQDGQHTGYATLCANTPAPVEAIETIYNVTPWIQRFEPGTSTQSQGTDTARLQGVEQQLQDLGYV